MGAVLFESERAFFFACSGAGIDAEKLRSHLRLGEQLGPDEMDELLEERKRRKGGDERDNPSWPWTAACYCLNVRYPALRYHA
jgi:hypothetical protein